MAAPHPTGQLVSILAIYLPECREKLVKLQKRAARYGQAITWTETPRTEDQSYVRPDGRKVTRTVERVDILISGEAPRVGEYELEAALERAPAGVIISSAPGVTVGKLGREWDGRCDHCGSTRARVHGYVVRKGRARKIVGKSCLRDHLGMDAPANIAGRFKFLRDLEGAGEDDDWFGGYGGSWNDLTVSLITSARAAIKLFGWRPASFEGMTTLRYVDLLKERHHESTAADRKALEAELRDNLAAYESEAEAIVEWARAIKPGRSDYLHNLQIACSGESVKAKHRGLVVSACAAFDKQKEVEAAKAAEKAKRPASDWIGTAGQRMTVDAELMVRRTLPDNGYGESDLFKFVREDGAIVSWITSSCPRIDRRPLEQGKRYRVKFTVKGHSSYQDVRETRATRMVVEAAL